MQIKNFGHRNTCATADWIRVDVTVYGPFVWGARDRVWTHGSCGNLVFATALPEQPRPTCEWASHTRTGRRKRMPAAELALTMVHWQHNGCSNLVISWQNLRNHGLHASWPHMYVLAL